MINDLFVCLFVYNLSIAQAQFCIFIFWMFIYIYILNTDLRHVANRIAELNLSDRFKEKKQGRCQFYKNRSFLSFYFLFQLDDAPLVLRSNGAGFIPHIFNLLINALFTSITRGGRKRNQKRFRRVPPETGFVFLHVPDIHHRSHTQQLGGCNWSCGGISAVKKTSGHQFHPSPPSLQTNHMTKLHYSVLPLFISFSTIIPITPAQR